MEAVDRWVNDLNPVRADIVAVGRLDAYRHCSYRFLPSKCSGAESLVEDIEIPFLNELIEKVEAVSAEAQQVAEAEREAEEVKRMISILSKAGFKIEKA